MKFIADKMLGRLATWLRICGFDTLYFMQNNTYQLILISLRDDRIILTRDTRLISKKGFKTFLVKSDKFIEQLEQVAGEFKLGIKESSLFTRCLLCNILLDRIKDKNTIKERVPQYVYDTQDEFAMCSVCGRIYWRGTHYEQVVEALKATRCFTK